jgi:hypothetical protein
MRGMAMGKRKRDRQPAMWVTTTDLPTAASHPFYRRLNQLLRDHGFDDFVEARCAGFYAETMGRPGLPPGIYFRLLPIGYFEGIDAERGIAWRCGSHDRTKAGTEPHCCCDKVRERRFSLRHVSRSVLMRAPRREVIRIGSQRGAMKASETRLQLALITLLVSSSVGSRMQGPRCRRESTSRATDQYELRLQVFDKQYRESDVCDSLAQEVGKLFATLSPL